MTPQPGTAGTDDDPLDSIETEELVVNGEVIDTLVGLAFDSANASDGVLRFDGSGSTNGITDGSAKVIVNGTVHDVAGAEWVDQSGTKHTVDSWEKVVNSQFDVSITGTTGPVAPGNTLDVTVDITNNGTDSDTQTVTLDIDNGVEQVDSQSVTLSGGGSTTQTLSWSVPSGQTEQDYQAAVASADDSASQTVAVDSTPASLVSHYTFDSADTNSGTAVDTVGSNDGTISGGVTTGDAGASQTYATAEAYDFDGSSGRVTAPTPTVSVANDFSVAMWVYPRSAGSGSVNAAAALNNSNDRVAMGFTSSEVVTNIFDGSFATQSDSFSAFGQWHHLVMTYDASTTSVSGYLNASSFTGSTAQGVGSNSSSFDIGFRGNGNHFDGRIDDVRVYDKVLTSTEVSNLYANGDITDGSAFFDVTITSTTGPVQPGNTLDVTAEVNSKNATQDTQTLTLSIDNSVGEVDSTSVTLSGGGSVTKTLSWSVPSGQTKQDYTATVASADDTASQTVTVSNIPSSLVSHWTLDDADTNSGTAVDVVGSNDGTIQGATTGVAGLAGYDSGEAYGFDGTDDNVAFGKNAFGSLNGQALSVAAWFNADSVPSSDSGFIYSQEGAITLNVEDANGDEIRAFASGTSSDLVSTAINTNTTYHAVLTYDGSGTQTLYLDGSQVDSQSGISMPDLSTFDRQVRVGAQYDNSRNFDGVIDDPRIYDKELTGTEVSNLYNNGRI